MAPRFRRLALAAALAAACATSSADVRITVNASDGPLGTAELIQSGQFQVEGLMSIAQAGALAIAGGDLASGALRASSYTSVVTDFQHDSRAQAVVSLSDTITFGEGASGTAYLDWGLHGVITVALGKVAPTTSAAILGIDISSSRFGSIASTNALATTGDCLPGYAFCVHGGSVGINNTLAFDIAPGTYTVSVGLSTHGLWGDDLDFMNTARLFLRLPDNVTFTSGSGVFLSTATPVPEPPKAWMLLPGAVLMAWVGRRRMR